MNSAVAMAEYFTDAETTSMTMEAVNALPSTELLKLLKQGIYPKIVLRMAHSETMETIPLATIIAYMKQERQMFLCRDKDNNLKIFKRSTVWYFIPSLCIEVANNTPSWTIWKKDCISMDFSITRIPATNIMPWLVGLLYDCCHCFTIVTSPLMSTASVGNVNVRADIIPDENKCVICIFWQHDCFKDKQHATIIAAEMVEMVETTTTLKDMIKKSDIWKIDVGGSKTQFDVETESEIVVRSMNESMHAKLLKTTCSHRL